MLVSHIDKTWKKGSRHELQCSRWLRALKDEQKQVQEVGQVTVRSPLTPLLEITFWTHVILISFINFVLNENKKYILVKMFEMVKAEPRGASRTACAILKKEKKKDLK